MRIVNLKDHKKVPVFKNIKYAVKMLLCFEMLA